MGMGTQYWDLVIREVEAWDDWFWISILFIYDLLFKVETRFLAKQSHRLQYYWIKKASYYSLGAN